MVFLNLLRCVFFRKLILFFTLFLSAVVYAVPPVNVVYRIDSRGPAEIFNAGFTSWGGDQSLLRYVSGESVRSQHSAFIATTTNWGSIERMAEIVVGYEEGDTAWIYEITPSNNFYDINGSLLAVAMGHYAEELRQQALGLYREYGWQEEFAALRRIEGDQVISARSITRNALGFLDVTDYVIFNAQYNRQRVPTTNPERIRQVGFLVSAAYYFGEFERRAVSPAFGIYECGAPFRLKTGGKEKKSAKDCFSIKMIDLVVEKRKTISTFIKSFSFSYF